MHCFSRLFVPVTLALGAAAGPVSNVRRGGTLERPGMPTPSDSAKDCTYWYDNDCKLTCQQLVWDQYISMEHFLQWNPSLGKNCKNFKINMSYCIDAPVPKVLPTSTTLKLEAPRSTSHNEVPASSSPAESTPTQAANGVETPSPLQPDMTKNCKKFYQVKDGDSCYNIAKDNGISTSQFTEWNGSVGKSCQNLWKGVYVCVGIIGQEAAPPANTAPANTDAPPSATKASNGIETPAPTQPGMVDNCNSFYMVKQGDTCADIAKSKGISQADFTKWNSGVGKKCENMWADVNVCVGVTQSTTTKKRRKVLASVTPTPFQPGMSSECDDFFYVTKGLTCNDIVSRYGISIEDFVKWNPGVGKDCSNMWVNNYVCVSQQC